MALIIFCIYFTIFDKVLFSFCHSFTFSTGFTWGDGFTELGLTILDLHNITLYYRRFCCWWLFPFWKCNFWSYCCRSPRTTRGENKQTISIILRSYRLSNSLNLLIFSISAIRDFFFGILAIFQVILIKFRDCFFCKLLPGVKQKLVV